MKNNNTKTVERTIDELGSTVKKSRKAVAKEAKKAVKDLKKAEKAAESDIDGTIKKLEKLADVADDKCSDALVGQISSEAKEVKKHLRQEFKKASRDIEGRADRFNDGVSKVLSDLEHQNAPFTDPFRIETSPIDAEGNYVADGGEGNVHNYADRISLHAEQTIDRIQHDELDALVEIVDSTNKIL